MQEKIIMAKARAKIINNKELGEEQELKGEILGNHQIFAFQTKQGKFWQSHTQLDSYQNPTEGGGHYGY